MQTASSQTVQIIFLVLTYLTITVILFRGMLLLEAALKSNAPDNSNRMFLIRALSEKLPGRQDDPPPPGTGTTPSEEPPSASRIGMALGTLVLAVVVLGVGYYIVYALFMDVDLTKKLDKIHYYFLSGAALFAPYAFNQLSSIFKGGNP